MGELVPDNDLPEGTSGNVVPDSDLPEAEPKASWLGAAKGVGEAALTLGSGTARGMFHAVNDLLPEAIGGRGSRAAAESDIAHNSVLNYQPKTDEGKYLMAQIQRMTAPIGAAAGAAHDYFARATSERAADVAGDVLALAPFGMREFKDIRGMARAGKDAIEQGHPLTDIAEGERARLGEIQARAQSSGFDLPEGGTPERHATAAVNNRPLVNAAARDELGLPKNADLTPNLLDKVRTAKVTPAYKTIRQLPDEIPLNQDALAEARTANMNGTPNERLPFPQGDVITGQQAVDFSQKARYLANQLEKNGQNPFARQDAQMYRDAAEAVEDSVRDHLSSTGRGKLAQDWDDARVYAAKSHSVENALDGAGNVRAADLKTQLFKKGKPLSGSLEDIANLSARYPEAFKISRVTQPSPGIVRRTVAGALPAVGAGVGGYLGGGLGGFAGERTGRAIGEKVLGSE